MSNQVKISVAVITYNQESTIAQTLDSILCQQGDFDLELVIGEDCSTDGTWQVCNTYAERYPDVVRLLPNTHNLGITANYFRVLEACTGDYISDIAGDDYYCDNHALEKQMTYMQNHSNVGVMAANGYKLYVSHEKYVPGLNIPVEDGEDSAKQFFFSPDYKGGVYAVPVGMMYRATMMQFIDFDEILRRKLPVEDFPIQAILSQHTHFACLSDLLVVYRVYGESATFISFDSPKYLEYHRGLADTRRYLNELFPQDACVPESKLQEQLFYKEFLLYLHQWKYKKAKQFIASAPDIIRGREKYKQAKRFTYTWMHFVISHIIKEYAYRKDLNQRI